MSNKNTIYYKQKQEFILDFSAEEISTDNYTGKVGEIHHIKVSGNPPVDSYYIPKD